MEDKTTVKKVQVMEEEKEEEEEEEEEDAVRCMPVKCLFARLGQGAGTETLVRAARW
jgi:hypothetical protein